MKLKNDKDLSISTKIAQALHFSDPETGSVVPSIEHSATYSRDENYQPRQAYWYRRDGNKTTQLAEKIISELENANASLLFSSGMSACTAVLEMLPAEAQIAVPRVKEWWLNNTFGFTEEFRDYVQSIIEEQEGSDRELDLG